jgi:hypothetical protein
MSTRRRRRGGKRYFAWPILAFGGILLIFAAFLFANSARGRNEGNGRNDGAGTPNITVDQEKIDYGYVKFGNSESFKIRVSNKGDGTLRFAEQPYVQVMEGC